LFYHWYWSRFTKNFTIHDGNFHGKSSDTRTQGAIIRVLTYRRYANITVCYFFVFSQLRNSCYLRTYFLLVLIGLMALRNVGFDYLFYMQLCFFFYLGVWTYFSETCTYMQSSSEGGGGGGGGQRGQFAPGPQCKGAPKFGK
jgi:hypothetical protein